MLGKWGLLGNSKSAKKGLLGDPIVQNGSFWQGSPTLKMGVWGFQECKIGVLGDPNPTGDPQWGILSCKNLGGSNASKIVFLWDPTAAKNRFTGGPCPAIPPLQFHMFNSGEGTPKFQFWGSHRFWRTTSPDKTFSAPSRGFCCFFHRFLLQLERGAQRIRRLSREISPLSPRGLLPAPSFPKTQLWEG